MVILTFFFVEKRLNYKFFEWVFLTCTFNALPSIGLATFPFSSNGNFVTCSKTTEFGAHVSSRTARETQIGCHVQDLSCLFFWVAFAPCTASARCYCVVTVAWLYIKLPSALMSDGIDGSRRHPNNPVRQPTCDPVDWDVTTHFCMAIPTVWSHVIEAPYAVIELDQSWNFDMFSQV